MSDLDFQNGRLPGCVSQGKHRLLGMDGVLQTQPLPFHVEAGIQATRSTATDRPHQEV